MSSNPRIYVDYYSFTDHRGMVGWVDTQLHTGQRVLSLEGANSSSSFEQVNKEGRIAIVFCQRGFVHCRIPPANDSSSEFPTSFSARKLSLNCKGVGMASVSNATEQRWQANTQQSDVQRKGTEETVDRYLKCCWEMTTKDRFATLQLQSAHASPKQPIIFTTHATFYLLTCHTWCVESLRSGCIFQHWALAGFSLFSCVKNHCVCVCVCVASTSLTASLGLDRSKMDCWNRTDELHWIRFDQACVSHIPASALQIQAFDQHTILQYACTHTRTRTRTHTHTHSCCICYLANKQNESAS